MTMATRRLTRRLTFAALAAAACVAALATGVDAANPPSWSAAAPAADSSRDLVGVSCASTSFCAAIDSVGDVITSSAPTTPTSWAQDTATGITHTVTSIACPPGGTFCVAGESAGDIAWSTTPSGSWTQETVDSGHTVESVSCPTTGLCVAVDNDGNAISSSAPTTNGWTPASIDGGTTLDAISCPTAALCAAVDASGNVLTSTSPTSGQAWKSASLTDVALDDISCDASGLCVAVDGSHDAFATADASAAPLIWSQIYSLDTSNSLKAVSCIDSGLCVVADSGGYVYSSDDVTAATPTWSGPTPIDAGRSLTAIACIDAGLCAAVDSSGGAVAGITAAPTPTTGTGSASSQTTATVTGTVDPGDATLTACQFDYGTTTAYGASVPCATTPTAGGGAQAVSAQIGGLNAGTTYHFALVASSAVASGAGADASFATPAPEAAAPSLSGTPSVGSTLTCVPHFTATGSETLAYQWLSNTAPIAGATAPTYVVPTSAEGDHLSCAVTVAGDGGSATTTSGFDAIPAQAGAKVTESYGGTVKHSGDSASVPATCSPQAAGSCTFTLTLTTPETVGHKTKATAVGSSTTKVATGTTRTLRVSLSAAGRRRLAQKHKLAITLTLKGTVIGILVATLQTDKLTFTDGRTTHAKTTKRHRTTRHAGARAR